MESAGLPLLSGPPPRPPSHARAEIGCRKCSKEFNVLFSRPRKCNHCGFSYCQSCTDYQALMPKENGYETMAVCGFCIEFLTFTAARKANLTNIPLAKLRKYAAAYNINIQSAVEKGDIIDTLIAARGTNGCLPPAKEQYYRTYSVPDRVDYTRPRGLFSRSQQGPTPTPTRGPPPPPPPRPEFARPDLTPDDPPPLPPRPTSQQPASQPPPPPPRPNPSTSYNPHYTSPPPPSFGSHPNRNTPPEPPRTSRPSRSTSNLRETPPSSSRPRATSAAPTPPPRPPPTLDELVVMEPEAIRSLSISALKSILFTNHVTAGSGVLEKDDLVKKVVDLVDQEKRERERHRLAEEQEERERIEAQRRMMEEFERKKKEAEKAQEEQTQNETEHSSSSPSPPPPPMPPSIERSGLCVVCQDEEANIAIVDCGHLAMCRACSELVMASSKECPLCRTRIVTEARLLRIFKS